jgi:hypothetical protein
MKETAEDIKKQIAYLKEAIKDMEMFEKHHILIPRQARNLKRRINTYKKDINNYKMKLIKGSEAAKSFMKKLRASKGKPKKKLSGSKHTDIKSHNYKITIGAAGDYAKFEISTIKALAKSLKKPIKVVQKAVYDDKHLLDLISNSFDTGKTPAQAAKLLKAHLVPKKEIKPLDAFVNLLTKKGKGQSSGSGSKANFPMKLPAMVTIGGISETDLIDEIQQTRKKILHFEKILKNSIKLLKTREYTNKKNSYMRANKKDQIKFYKKVLLQEKKLLRNLLQIKKVF